MHSAVQCALSLDKETFTPLILHLLIVERAPSFVFFYVFRPLTKITCKLFQASSVSTLALSLPPSLSLSLSDTGRACNMYLNSRRCLSGGGGGAVNKDNELK